MELFKNSVLQGRIRFLSYAFINLNSKNYTLIPQSSVVEQLVYGHYGHSLIYHQDNLQALGYSWKQGKPLFSRTEKSCLSRASFNTLFCAVSPLECQPRSARVTVSLVCVPGTLNRNRYAINWCLGSVYEGRDFARPIPTTPLPPREESPCQPYFHISFQH